MVLPWLVDGREADFEIGDGGEGGATGILSIRSIGAFLRFWWIGAGHSEWTQYLVPQRAAATIVEVFSGSRRLSDELPTQLTRGRYIELQTVSEKRYSLLNLPNQGWANRGYGSGRLRIVKCVTDHDKNSNQSARESLNLLTNKHFWYHSRKRINPRCKILKYIKGRIYELISHRNASWWFWKFCILASRYKRCPSDKVLFVFGKTDSNRFLRCIHTIQSLFGLLFRF